MTEHTKGDWKAKTLKRTDHRTIHIISEQNDAICEIPHRFEKGTKGIEEHEANATLIIASPGMLKCIKEQIIWLDVAIKNKEEGIEISLSTLNGIKNFLQKSVSSATL